MSTPPIPNGLDDTSTTRVANRLHSIAIHLLRRARREDRATGLTPERLSLLSVLVFAGPLVASRLAEIEMVSRPAITRTLNALEEQGLVRRERSDEDRRRFLVHATSRGREVIEKGRRARIRRIASELAGLEPAEVESLARAAAILERLQG